MRKHSVPTPEEARVRPPNGVDPDVQIACRNCGLFGVKDGEDGCDFWAEGPEVQCLKKYSGVRCERTHEHKGACQQKWMSKEGVWIGMRILDRKTIFDAPGSIPPDAEEPS